MTDENGAKMSLRVLLRGEVLFEAPGLTVPDFY